MRAPLRPLLAILILVVSPAGMLPAAAQDSQVVYESPTYGFTLTWDDTVWDVVEDETLVASGPAALDRIRLVPGNGPNLYIEGASYRDASPASCISAELERLENNPTRTDFRPYVRPDGTELAGEADGVAFAAYQYRAIPETGDPFDSVVYINCRLIPGSGASILFTLLTVTNQFEPYLAETERIIASVTMPTAASSSTPVATAESGRYDSPTYSYVVTWDAGLWSVDESATLVAGGSAAIDRVRLRQASGVILYVDGGVFEYPDVAACVRGESDLIAAAETRSEYRPFVQEDGAELTGETDGAAFAAFQYVLTPETGEPYDEVVYIECRPLAGTDATLVFTLFASPSAFEQALTEARAVIDSTQLDVVAWFAAQVETATAEPSVVGPLSGELVQSTERVSLALAAANEQNFYLRARFQNPSDADEAPWDFGIQFRNGAEGYYRLIINSTGRWALLQDGEVMVEAGSVMSLTTDAGATNALELVAAGETGAFRLNGEETAGPLDLSAIMEPGQVSVGTAFYTSNTVEGAVTNYRDVEVWRLAADEPAATPGATATAGVPTDSIQTAVAARTPQATVELPTIPVPPVLTPTVAPTSAPEPTAAPSPTTEATATTEPGPTPVVDMAWFDAQVAAATAEQSFFGPAAGELEHSLERVSQYIIATDVDNFYLRVDFQNPADGATTMWDMGVLFRAQAGGEHYRLIIDSTSRWRLMIGTESLEDIGSVATLDTAAEATNTLELVAVGNVGAFRLNGEHLAGPLDLSAIQSPGGLWLGAAFSNEATIEGGVTRFRELQVWPVATAAEPLESPTAEPTLEGDPIETAVPTATQPSIPTIPGTQSPEPTPTPSVPLIPTQTATGEYESPLFGYTLTWDSAWIELGRGSADIDTLVLSNGTSYVAVTGLQATGADAAACQANAARGFEHLPGFSSVLVNGEPLAGGDQLRAWGVYRYTSAEGEAMIAYFECRSMPSQGATVLIAMTTPEEAYNAQAALLASLLENLVLPE